MTYTIIKILANQFAVNINYYVCETLLMYCLYEKKNLCKVSKALGKKIIQWNILFSQKYNGSQSMQWPDKWLTSKELLSVLMSSTCARTTAVWSRMDNNDTIAFDWTDTFNALWTLNVMKWTNNLEVGNQTLGLGELAHPSEPCSADSVQLSLLQS